MLEIEDLIPKLKEKKVFDSRCSFSRAFNTGGRFYLFIFKAAQAASAVFPF